MAERMIHLQKPPLFFTGIKGNKRGLPAHLCPIVGKLQVVKHKVLQTASSQQQLLISSSIPSVHRISPLNAVFFSLQKE